MKLKRYFLHIFILAGSIVSSHASVPLPTKKGATEARAMRIFFNVRTGRFIKKLITLSEEEISTTDSILLGMAYLEAIEEKLTKVAPEKLSKTLSDTVKKRIERRANSIRNQLKNYFAKITDEKKYQNDKTPSKKVAIPQQVADKKEIISTVWNQAYSLKKYAEMAKNQNVKSAFQSLYDSTYNTIRNLLSKANRKFLKKEINELVKQHNKNVRIRKSQIKKQPERKKDVDPEEEEINLEPSEIKVLTLVDEANALLEQKTVKPDDLRSMQDKLGKLGEELEALEPKREQQINEVKELENKLETAGEKLEARQKELDKELIIKQQEEELLSYAKKAIEKQIKALENITKETDFEKMQKIVNESLQIYNLITGTFHNLTIEKNKETLQKYLTSLRLHIFKTTQSDMYKWYKFRQTTLEAIKQYSEDFGNRNLSAQHFTNAARAVNLYIRQTSAIDDTNNEKIKSEKNNLILKLQTLQKQLIEKAKEVKKTKEADI